MNPFLKITEFYLPLLVNMYFSLNWLFCMSINLTKVQFSDKILFHAIPSYSTQIQNLISEPSQNKYSILLDANRLNINPTQFKTFNPNESEQSFQWYSIWLIHDLQSESYWTRISENLSHFEICFRTNPKMFWILFDALAKVSDWNAIYANQSYPNSEFCFRTIWNHFEPIRKTFCTSFNKKR